MDLREAILARLVEIADAVATDAELVGVHRNDLDLPDEVLPAIVVLDGDEAADDSDPEGRQPLAPRRVGMTPELYVMYPAKADVVGTRLNSVRTKLIYAILTDATLLALTLNGRSARYDGAASGLARGRTMLGEMGVSFKFTYLMKPADFAPVTA